MINFRIFYKGDKETLLADVDSDYLDLEIIRLCLFTKYNLKDIYIECYYTYEDD